jgi:hypothetical protein
VTAGRAADGPAIRPYLAQPANGLAVTGEGETAKLKGPKLTFRSIVVMTCNETFV